MKLRITVEDVSYEVEVEILEGDAPGAVVAAPSQASTPVAAVPAAPVARPSAPHPTGGTSDNVCRSPIAGTIIQMKVKPGDKVAVNQTLMIMEAMKMETNIASPVAGVVKTIHVKPGDAVKQGQLLVEF